MCGIGGIYLPDETSRWLPRMELSFLWEGLENRGTHACGFAVQWKDADAPVVMKWPHTATKHIDSLETLASGSNVRYAMLHTRYATQGNVSRSANNHPVVIHRMLVTHNGVLRDWRQIFKTLRIHRRFDVDTEAINASLRLKSPSWTINNLTGSISVAWVDLDDTSTIHLMTNGLNPLAIGRLKSGHMVWASTDWHLEDAFGDLLERGFHALPFKQYTLSPDGSIRSHWLSKRRSEAHLGLMPHPASWRKLA